MTILTSANDKKPEKVVAIDGVPILATAPPTAPSVVGTSSLNGDAESMIYYTRRRMSVSTSIFLFLSALAVMLMGILGGVTIYRLYAPSQNRMHFHGFCDVPYDSQSLSQIDELRQFIEENLSNSSGFFREEYELDLSDDQSYSKINVPDFQDGRRGRFMHDFKENQSAIIDTTAFRCFVMPLDRETVLPPKNFADLMEKMRNGYYDIDTERIRENWRVMTPEITDTSTISRKIASECIGMKIYLLEKYISGVFKRSVNDIDEAGKFAVFSGKHIIEVNLVNINEIEELEKNS